MSETLQQLALFSLEAPCPLSGLSYHADFIAPAEEQSLLTALDEGVWSDDINRRAQQFGYHYSIRSRIRANAAQYAGPLPAWCRFVTQRIQARDLFTPELDQMIAQEYLPGQGIGLHTDLESLREDVVCILSLGSQVEMTFLQPSTGARWARMLWPRSLLLIAGEARYDWQHGIPKRRSDFYEARRLPRGRRISLSFRHLGKDAYPLTGKGRADDAR